MRGTTWLTLSLLSLMLCTAVAAWAQEYWVDASAGSDNNAGTEQLPFATITHAIATVGENTTIHVMPGTYDEVHGEVFPIVLAAGQRLIGDPPTKGEGIRVSGVGPHETHLGTKLSTVVCEANSELGGFELSSESNEDQASAVLTYSENVVIYDNTFLPHFYAGIRMIDLNAGVVRDNVFKLAGQGVHLFRSAHAPDPGCYCPVVQANRFTAQGDEASVWVRGFDAVIEGNTFAAGSFKGVVVYYGSAPRISGNIFEAGSGTLYAVYIDAGAASKLRANVFGGAEGIRIMGIADLGTAADPGLNDFTAVEGVSLGHWGDQDIWAIGNTWPNEPPIFGEDIFIYGEGSVILGPVPTQSTSVSKLKTSFD